MLEILVNKRQTILLDCVKEQDEFTVSGIAQLLERLQRVRTMRLLHHVNMNSASFV